MFGLLNIRKPPTWTSRDVVNRVQRLVRPHKAGHAGTLDPLATGVLVVCVGAATRLIEYVQAGRKHYRGTFLLGRESDTEDIEGDVRELVAPPVPSREEIAAALPSFVGQQLQRPPAYSALKVAGQRAYDLARQGKPVELAPRPIEVFSLALVGYAYPEVVLDIECGGGTYVRSLGRDIAASLGTAAAMSGLVRTAVGSFGIEDACELEELTPENLASKLLPAALAVQDLPRIALSADELARVRQGKRLMRDDAHLSQATETAAFDESGELAALLISAGTALWQPSKVMAH
jgi:tRNA pseudouridine55 synthase